MESASSVNSSSSVAGASLVYPSPPVSALDHHNGPQDQGRDSFFTNVTLVTPPVSVTETGASATNGPGAPKATKVGSPWSVDEELRLLAAVQSPERRDLAAIASDHKRTLNGIVARLRQIAVRLVIDKNMTVDAASEAIGSYLTPDDVQSAVRVVKEKEASSVSSSCSGTIRSSASSASTESTATSKPQSSAAAQLMAVMEKQHTEHMAMLTKILESLDKVQIALKNIGQEF